MAAASVFIRDLEPRMIAMRKIFLLLGAAFLIDATAAPVLAQEHGDRGDRGHWHGDIHHFRDYDFDAWRGGHWYHGFHDGRGGWWWLTGGGWYFYPAPVYPYPDPYTPPGVTVIAGPPGAYVYYCANPAGYYPYVPQCYAPWQAVASTAPAPAAPPAMAAPPPMADQHEQDERQLNAFGAEFVQIDPAAPHARAKLKRLETRVEGFRQSLYERQYNAMDLLKNSEQLTKRIAAERAKIPLAPPAAAPSAPPP